MVLFRILRSRLLYTFLSHHNNPPIPKNSIYTSPITHSCFSPVQECKYGSKFFFVSSIFQRTLSTSVQLEDQVEMESIDSGNDESTEGSGILLKKKKSKGKKDLDVMFKEAVGLMEKVEGNESSEEELKEGEYAGDSRLKEIKELKKRLRKLEREVRSVKGKVMDSGKPKKKSKEDGVSEVGPKPKSLHAVFTSKPNQKIKPDAPAEKDKPRLKELSSEMVSLVTHFYEEGYLNDANFLSNKTFDLSRFSDHYSRYFLRFAAERFGKDKQEIAKWLNGSDLKKIARFGCPSIEKKAVFAAKRLRTFFSIQEAIVCRACNLKNSCKSVNKGVSKVENLDLADVMRILILYDLDLVPPELNVPEEIRSCVTKSLKEVINLSQ